MPLVGLDSAWSEGGLVRISGSKTAGCCSIWCGSTELLGSGPCPRVGNRVTSMLPVPTHPCCPQPAAHSHSLSLPRVLHSIPPSAPCLPSPADEVYAQKMKYKAISEELDNALNDITSL